MVFRGCRVRTCGDCRRHFERTSTVLAVGGVCTFGELATYYRLAGCAGKKDRSRLRGVSLVLLGIQPSQRTGPLTEIIAYSVVSESIRRAGGQVRRSKSGINSWVLEVSALNPSKVCEPDAESPGTFRIFLETRFEI